MKDIKNYEGLYAVDEDGNVWSYRSKKYLKPVIVSGGYCRVDLRKSGEHNNCYVHRLIAETFIPNPENKPQVNHKDENKLNNSVSNLEWTTAQENNNYGTRNERIRKAHNKKIYCVELDKIFESGKKAAEELGLHNSHITSCCKGKQKTTGGYHFRYGEVS